MTAASAPKKINVVQAVNMALDWALANDPSVILLGEDIADGQGGGVMGVTHGLSTRHGVERVMSTPISEMAIVGAAIGAGLVGMRPVAEVMIVNFSTVAMDQIVNHAAKLRYMSGGQTHVPITIRMAAGVGAGTGGQHSDMYEAWFAHVPGLKVVAPTTPEDAYGLLLSCIFDDDPCIFIENYTTMFGVTGHAPAPGTRVPIGKAKVVKAGHDVTVIGYGHPIIDARTVADELEAEGISVEVLDLRTVSPLDDEAILASVAKTGRAVVTHAAVGNCGVGAEIAARIHARLHHQLKAPVARVTSKNTTVPFASVLEKAFMWSAQELKDAIRGTLAHTAA